MPRVRTVTKSKRGKPVTCTACRKVVEAGQQMYTWQRYGLPQRVRHVTCGFPRPTELSGAKTAAVVEAQEDAVAACNTWTPDLHWDADERSFEVNDGDADELTAALQNAIDEANSAADEYEEGADNMPESLQDGMQAEAMREVADELRNWASDLEEFSPDSVDLSDFDGQVTDDMQKDDEAWVTLYDEATAAVDEWVEATRQEAIDLLEANDVPEYTG